MSRNFFTFTKKRMFVIFAKIFMFLAGSGLILLSAASIIKKQVISLNIFSVSSGSLLARSVSVALQLITGAGLITGSVALYMGLPWGVELSLVFLASMVYISLKGLSWAPGNRLDIFRMTAFAGSAASIVIIMLSYR